MGFFTLGNRFLNEAEINGQPQDQNEEEDYSVGADGDDTTSTDTATDTTSTTDATTDTTTTDTAGEEDYTDGADADVSVDDTETDSTTDSSTTDEEDYSAGADADISVDDTSDSATTDSSDSGDGDVDYADGADADIDASGEGDSSGSDTTTDSTDGGTEGAEGTVDNLKKIEAELFSNLTPEQLAIKNTELKARFIEVYSTITNVLVRINDIPKTDDNIETLKFVTDKLLEMKELVDHNITTSFQTRTYTENNIIYQQCLATLDAINTIINNIPSPTKNDNDEDDSDSIVDDNNASEDTSSDNNGLAVSDTSTMKESGSILFDMRL